MYNFENYRSPEGQFKIESMRLDITSKNKAHRASMISLIILLFDVISTAAVGKKMRIIRW